jgi:hypothetical protein
MRVLTKVSFYLFASALLSLISCSEENKKNTVALDKIRPKAAAKDSRITAQTKNDTLQKWINYYTNDSASLEITNIAPDSSELQWFLDRFSKPIKSFILQDTNTIQYQVRTWAFKDTSNCLEAFYNWLDQAGKNKSSVTLNSGNIHASANQIFAVSDKYITVIQSDNTINLNKWMKWMSGTKEFQKLRYVTFTPAKKRTKWLLIENGKIKKS